MAAQLFGINRGVVPLVKPEDDNMVDPVIPYLANGLYPVDSALGLV